jgi:hypothetical protein
MVARDTYFPHPHEDPPLVHVYFSADFLRFMRKKRAIRAARAMYIGFMVGY